MTDPGPDQVAEQIKTKVLDAVHRFGDEDAVQNVVRQVRGSLRVTQEALLGTRFVMQLPLTLSVIRSLIVEVDGEPYVATVSGANVWGFKMGGTMPPAPTRTSGPTSGSWR